MEHLLDFFDRYIRGSSPAFFYDDGFRRWSYTHDQLRAAAEAWARELVGAGLHGGDRLLIWSDSRPEWVAAFWGCMLCGITVVPVDAAASPDFVARIVRVAGPRGLLLGEGLTFEQVSPAVRMWRVRDTHWLAPRGAAASQEQPEPRAQVDADTIAEIVFTSGTTGEPKGVVITHRNIVANIMPIEHEVAAYRRYLWPFRPIRFLGLLPLSHMFGQALSIFFPPLVDASTVFTASYNPDQIIEQVARHRITLLVTVPRVLEMLRERVRLRAPSVARVDAAERPLAVRLWSHRDVHRRFGWRFCGFVVGGAALDPDLEQFWGGLGYAVVQGYGLTETAPIVAWNNPFTTMHGTVGRPLEGVEVRIAADGEILVRGPTVTTGYLNAPDETRTAMEGGWFHTGDLGLFDDSGHLVIRGRKKDVIATPEGLKVFPEDVERVLQATAGVREAAVIGRRTDHAESVHAVLVLDPHADPDAIVRAANQQLEPHQRIRDMSVWTDGPLPRTDPMRKLKRFAIRRWVEQGGSVSAATEQSLGDDVERLLSKYVKGRAVTAEMTLDELGLTSLDRIELMMALEDRARTTLSETAVSEARTVGDLRRLTQQPTETGVTSEESFQLPRWNRWLVVRLIRNLSQRTWILPLAHLFFHLDVEGREHLRSVDGPVVFASNHQSHFDTPVILTALPNRLRRVIAVAMWKEYFDAYFVPHGHSRRDRLTMGALYYLVAGFFNAFPLPQAEPGARDAIRYMGELATSGFSILIFPEGFRTERGEISTFQPGIGLIASRLHLAVVPVRLEGVDRVLHHTWHWPKRGSVRVTFGAPIVLEGNEYAALAQRVQQAVVALQPAGGEPAECARDAVA